MDDWIQDAALSRRTLLEAAAVGSAVLAIPDGVAADAPPHPDRLWYTTPAEKWTEALPIGNGRLGRWSSAAPRASDCNSTRIYSMPGVRTIRSIRRPARRCPRSAA